MRFRRGALPATESRVHTIAIGGERLFTLPNLLSLARLPLAGMLWVAPGSRLLLLSTLTLAGLTDILDGWAARRCSRASSTLGAWLDPVCDKVFVVSALLAVWVATDYPIYLAALIAMRELTIVPLFLAYRLARRRGAVRRFDFRAGLLGKLTTVAQFGALVSLLLGWAITYLLASLAALFGLLTGVAYARRGWRRVPASRTPTSLER